MANSTVPNKNTGDQITAGEINNIVSSINSKQDAVAGKGLSTNDLTDVRVTKLDALSEHYVGNYTSLSSLQSAHPVGSAGQYATVDVAGQNAQTYIWDVTETSWVPSGSTAGAVTSVNSKTGAVVLSKADINLGYVPNIDATDRVNHTGTQFAGTISDFATTTLNTLLDGLGLLDASDIAATDKIVAAFGKLQAQIKTKLNKLIGFYATQTASFNISADMVDTVIRCNHATVPIVATLNDDTFFSIGQTFTLKQIGLAGISIVAGGATTINFYAPQGIATTRQHSSLVIVKQNANAYSVTMMGDDTTKVDKIAGKGLSTNDYDNAAVAKLNSLSGFKPTDYANSAFFEKANGMYYPILTAEGLDNPTANTTNGLANHASGGVVAAVAGTAGNGNIYLPIPIDPTKPWRAAVLIEINDSNSISNLQISDASGNFNTGIKMTAISTNQISGTFGAGTFCQNIGNGSGGIPAGTKVWIGMASDGNDVHAYLIPDATPIYFNFNGVPTSASAYDARAFSKKLSNSYASNGIKVFGDNSAQTRYRINRLSITTTSVQNRIIGVWMNQGLGGPNDGRLQPPAMLTTTIYQDASACIVIPKKTGYLPVDMVMMNHQNAYNTAGNFNNTNNAGLALSKLYAAGYMVFGIDGVYNGSTPAPGDGTEATNSNWGAATGMKYRKGIWEWTRSNIPGTRKIFLWGWSMGFLNSLRQSIQYPGQIAGIIGTSGVCDLTDCITNRGFSATVQKAFSTFYAALVANTGLNPSMRVTVGAAGAAIGATSVPVSAISQALASGTILTLNTGTGQVQITLTAAASSGAVSLTVAALTVAINNGAIYDLSNYWIQLNYGFGQPDELYYKAPYVWRDTWVTGTAYSQNDISCVASTGTVKTFYFVDPVRNVNEFLNIPILIFQGDSDTLIPASQAQSFTTALQAVGGNVTLNIVSGAGHLDPALFGATYVTQMINWLNNLTS